MTSIVPIQFSENDLDNKNKEDYIMPEKRKPEALTSGLTENRILDSDEPSLLFPNNYCNGKSMSQPRFIKFIPSERYKYLIRYHPLAFILLTVIADRARRIDGNIDGLNIGEAFIGDHQNMGLTRQNYRTSLKALVRLKFLEITENCRTRKKSTTGTTTVGTKVKLIDSTIYDINIEDTNHRSNHRLTTGQPPPNHEQEIIKKDKKDKNIDNLGTNFADDNIIYKTGPASSPSTSNDLKNRSQPSKPKIRFCFDSNKFIGLDEKFIESMRESYPGVKLDQEFSKMKAWLISNPSKAPKNQYASFINRWLSKAQDQLALKSMPRSYGQPVNRAPKNADGTLAPNPYEGLF